MGFSAAHQRQSLQDVDLKEVTQEALREFFRPEFVNRIDEVIMFNPLNEKVCQRIAGNMLREVTSLLKLRGITATFSPQVRVRLAKEGFSESMVWCSVRSMAPSASIMDKVCLRDSSVGYTTRIRPGPPDSMLLGSSDCSVMCCTSHGGIGPRETSSLVAHCFPEAIMPSPSMHHARPGLFNPTENTSVSERYGTSSPWHQCGEHAQ